MASANLAWDQRPDYLAYTDWTPVPGVTSYAVPRNGTGTDATQFHPGQAFLSEHNLPDIMYQLHPCAEWRRFKSSPLPEPKINPDGSPVYEQWTRPGKQRQQLLDFKILPDKISTKEAWWYHEFVRRMDLRIRQRDIIMREEVCAERLRMTDQRYINIHLNTPGYRIYRPAWKMIAWHVKAGDARQNQRKQSVLDGLTEAQKQANTTRGSTPGLINPALGDTIGNRIPLPDLMPKKRGPRSAAVNVHSIPGAETARSPQFPQAPQFTPAAQVAQAHQAHRIQQTPPFSQSQQLPDSSRVGSSDPEIVLSSVASAAMNASFQNVFNTAARPEQNILRGQMNARARDVAAMPPPPLPLNPRNDQFHQPQVFASHPDTPYSTNRASVTNKHMPKPEYPFMSDEEIANIATMSAKSDQAMTEIYRICEPFLDPCSDMQDQPTMDLSAELVNDLGIGVLFPKQAGRMKQRRGNEHAILNPAQTMQARNVEQPRVSLSSKKRGTKRKDIHDGIEPLQYVQLDEERQERRSIKRVKSVHNTNFPTHSGPLYSDAAINTQQQPHFAPGSGDHQSGYSQGHTFRGSSLRGTQQGVQHTKHASAEDADLFTRGSFYKEQNEGVAGQHPHQTVDPYHPYHYTATPLKTTFPDRQPSLKPYVSPYLSIASERDEISNHQYSNPQPRASVEKYPNGHIRASQALGQDFPIYTPNPYAQPASQQSTTAHPRARVDRGHHREPREQNSTGRRFHPYASSRNGNAQGMAATKLQKLDDEYRPQPIEAPTARNPDLYMPDVAPASRDDPSPPFRESGTPLDPHSKGLFVYKDNDPRKGLDVKATRKVLDWFSQRW